MKFLTNHCVGQAVVDVVCEELLGVIEAQRIADQTIEGWLKDKIIGEPQATAHLGVDELKRMGVVGVYSRE